MEGDRTNFFGLMAPGYQWGDRPDAVRVGKNFFGLLRLCAVFCGCLNCHDFSEDSVVFRTIVAI